MPNIAIIGGGVAGLSAAAKLTQQGKSVTLFETSATLGGRARGIRYKGMQLDNGQHILLGAYHETLNLLKLAGVIESQVLTRLPLKLQVNDLTGGKPFVLAAPPWLPAPIHVLWGLFAAKGLGFADKRAALYLMAWLRIKHFQLKQDQPLADLLATHKQTQALTQRFWEPLCLAALNTPLNQASAQVFLNVLRDSFARKKQDADILLAKTDLTTLLSEPIAHYLRNHGSTVHTGMPVESITPVANGYNLQTKTESHTFDQVIMACGPHQLKSFAATLPKLAALTQHFTYQPITTVYLQYPENAQLSAPMIGAINSLTQWVFDRGQICNQKGLIAVVISAHKPFKQTQGALSAHIATELASLFPQLGKPLWHKVITEKRATFSCDVALPRPANRTAYPNLYIAGDYTAGDYPATIEGAVRSGMLAASAID